MPLPMPKAPQKPPEKPVSPPAFLGGGRFRSTDEIKTEIRKGIYSKNIPTYGKIMEEGERVKFIEEISKDFGGLSAGRMDTAIKRLTEEKRAAEQKHQDAIVRQLDQKIKETQELKRMWTSPNN